MQQLGYILMFIGINLILFGLYLFIMSMQRVWEKVVATGYHIAIIKLEPFKYIIIIVGFVAFLCGVCISLLSR